MSQKFNINRNEESTKLIVLIQASLLFGALILSHKFQVTNCEAKEFDWSELDVSLSGPKSSLNSGTANNLRILVSPQRRMTKNYELDYNNNSQPTSAQGEASYVIPGSGGNSYLTQSVGQLSSTQPIPSHTSAYSALSASLASLKSRLNARSVTLNNPMSDGSSQSNLYQNSAGTYGSSLMSDSQQQQAQVQPTYLSVASQQDQRSSGGYTGVQNQSNENKTIVLAIPAKINFLTDSRSTSSAKQQQQQQQPQQQEDQQLTAIQPSNDQQTRNEYSAKQIAIINGQDGSVDQTGRIRGRDVNSDQEQHQYVIVNSPASSNGLDRTQLIATNLGQNSANPQIPGSMYPSFTYTPTNLQSSNLGSFAMKYIPTYHQSTVQQPTVQKLYSSGEQRSSFESQINNDQSNMNRYSSCIDTCDSADVRWRKFTISKYKSCCSRSAQYDVQLEQPSANKLREISSKYADDAYYNYLYRRSRARNSKKSHRSHNRYNRYLSIASSSNPEENSRGETGSLDLGRKTSGRSYQYDQSPYMKYYKSRQSLEPLEGMTRDGVESTSSNNGKYAFKERSYRRGRSRDFSDTLSSQPNYESNEDESSYISSEPIRSTSGYGSGEYSVDSGRYPIEPRNPNINDEDETLPSYEDNSDQESNINGAISESPDYSSESAMEGSNEESEPETTTSYKYIANRRRKHIKSKKGGKELKYNKKNRKDKFSNKLEYSSSQVNKTDFESTQPGGNQYHSESITTNEEDQSIQNNSTITENRDSEKEAISISNKYNTNLNDSAVANLSKTTMHLKEILSILEKKAHLKANESISGQASQQTTPSPVPITTTTSLYPFSIFGNSQYNNPTLQGVPSSDYLTPEINLKSPYRFESLSSSPNLSLPPPYSPLGLDSYSPMSNYGPNQYGLQSTKHLTLANGPPHLRKRRINKNLRYNHLMFPKTHGFGASSSLLQAAVSKNPFLNPAYYSLQYPYWYTRGNSPSVINSYPYKNLNKGPYSSLLNSAVSSKLTSSGSYSDESRFHGMTNYDPIANVASSLRPSTTMRLRSKPFVFQPNVLPIYTRHTILTQPLDAKK